MPSQSVPHVNYEGFVAVTATSPSEILGWRQTEVLNIHSTRDDPEDINNLVTTLVT